MFYQSWTRYLPDTVELCSVELPGRGTRAGRPSCTDMGVVVSGIAEAVSDQSDSRSMVLFGHSVGALLAYEVTRALRREGQRLPKMLALSGIAKPLTSVPIRQRCITSWQLTGRACPTSSGRCRRD